MGIEVRPFGVRCNIRCHYCYQSPERAAGSTSTTYDIAALKLTLDKMGREFSLFGGEPLLMPLRDLEEIWAFGLERFGKNSIQTNGNLITPRHIELFRKYKVTVGISVDGPGELNDLRWVHSLVATRDATARTTVAIDSLSKCGMPPSLIVTLHRKNGTLEKTRQMHEWIGYLDSIGVQSVRLHLLESEDNTIRTRYALTSRENLDALVSYLELEPTLSRLRFDMFEDMRNMLLGKDNKTTCVWNACDPYTTKAVQGIEGNGQSSNCGRTNKDGIGYPKANSEGFERYIALYHTPQEFGGCQGCRFFLMCKGQCPGTAVEGDWRNKTEHCEVLKGLYELLEHRLTEQGVIPISDQPVRKSLEERFLVAWSTGQNTSMAQLLTKTK